MSLRQYDPLQVTGSWAPANLAKVDIVDGAIAGDFLAVARDNPDWSREFDRAGNATRVKQNNRGGTVTVTLSASSPTNRALSIARQTDVFTENVVGFLLLKDLNGDTVIEAEGAFIEGPPLPTYGAERGSRTWVFQCAKIRAFVGGHDLA